MGIGRALQVYGIRQRYMAMTSILPWAYLSLRRHICVGTYSALVLQYSNVYVSVANRQAAREIPAVTG